MIKLIKNYTLILFFICFGVNSVFASTKTINFTERDLQNLIDKQVKAQMNSFYNSKTFQTAVDKRIDVYIQNLADCMKQEEFFNENRSIKDSTSKMLSTCNSRVSR